MFPQVMFLVLYFSFQMWNLEHWYFSFVSLSDMKLSKMNRMFSYWPSYFKSLAVNDISTRCGFFPLIFKFDLLEAADSEFQELEEWKLSLHSYFYLFILKNCHLFLFWFIFSNSHIFCHFMGNIVILIDFVTLIEKCVLWLKERYLLKKNTLDSFI